ncbi:acylneuraminate cytidylyltransferase family protein [Aliarcobacter skirrowii]|uniref:acylneuraminate cytidylyltransferase family protein n=1 Tax=Aliarcobacter skirrowii TaxID=28200 RepID=UPI0029A63B96|nr:acylneuraminate cytidylyltransferase family protein [Aliarcobacter skirrowii]MDX4060337.1 acylneuraminate cytidylyltransferase family protein [Aliarcobacter skirrowii]
MSINVFLPCRKGSQRVPKKNIKEFAGFKNGLIEIKLKQLLECKKIDTIYLSTNDEEILAYAESLNQDRIILHKRAEYLSSSETSTDNLVSHVLKLIPEGDILWTHVTSPFLNANAYDDIIKKYQEVKQQGFDSLMTTNLIHGFLWNKEGPINYDRTKEKWPRTQTIEPLHEINSAVFLADTEIYRNLKDRIGNNPFLYELDKIKGFDIDWEDDFKIAEAIVKAEIIKL